MAFILKRVQSRLTALFACLAFLFGAAGAPAQEASVAAPRADSKALNNAEFIAAADEVLRQMSEITGLKLLTPLKKS